MTTADAFQFYLIMIGTALTVGTIMGIFLRQTYD